MDEWKIGDPADWGDHVGVPDIPYMGYLNNETDDDDPEENSGGRGIVTTEDNILGEEARKLYKKFKYEKALTQIDLALSKNTNNARNWKIKAKILCSLERFKESEECFDKSLSINESDVVFGDKARMLLRWGYKYSDENNLDKATEKYTEARKLIDNYDTNEDAEGYDYLKLRIDAKRRQFELYDKQKKELESYGRKNLILVLGMGYISHGTKFKLVKKEEDIDVYIDDEKRGYVAKYDFTEENLVTTVFELENLPKISYSEYLFPYRDHYTIAKLLK